MSDFTCTTPGIAIQLEVPSSILNNSTNLNLVFETIDGRTRLQFPATSTTSANGNPCAQYVTTGADFTVPGIYFMELLYTATGFSIPSSTNAPFPTMVVAPRL